MKQELTTKDFIGYEIAVEMASREADSATLRSKGLDPYAGYRKRLYYFNDPFVDCDKSHYRVTVGVMTPRSGTPFETLEEAIKYFNSL
jgi:hypothetical protein